MTDEEILRIYKKEPYEHGYKMLASTKNEDRSVLSPFALGLAEIWKLGGTDPGGIYVSLVIIAIVEQLFKKNSIEDIKKYLSKIISLQCRPLTTKNISFRRRPT